MHAVVSAGAHSPSSSKTLAGIRFEMKGQRFARAVRSGDLTAFEPELAHRHAGEGVATSGGRLRRPAACCVPAAQARVAPHDLRSKALHGDLPALPGHLLTSAASPALPSRA
jgi:hypothetical protein